MNKLSTSTLTLLLLLTMVGCSSTPSDDNNVVVVVEEPQPLRVFYDGEFETIMEAAEANDCTEPELLSILFAIRTAENGRKGIEFGVLHPRAVDQPNSLRVQAGWCAATVSKNHKRWIDSGKTTDFITFLGNRYCPVGADNDPNGLNKHWIPNVRKLAKRNSDVMNK